MSQVNEDLQISYGWLEHYVNAEKQKHEFLGDDLDDPQ